MKKKLQYVYKLLAQIVVSGDDVERMAAVKSVLKGLYEEVNDDGGDGGQQNPGSTGT